MATSAWRSYITRSMEHLRDRTTEVLRAQPAPIHGPILPLLSLKSQEDLQSFVLGCDTDLGGKSSVNLDLGPEGKGRLWGTLSSELQMGRKKEGVIERGGYAGMRSKSRTTMFGSRTWDTSLHDFLRLRVRSSGDGMRYFVNIQTDGPVRSDLFQHRLWLPTPISDSAPHEWTNVLIPFSDFTLTNSGDLSEKQMEMLRTRVRTVGISVLGPREGRYELGIESIDAVSLDSEDVRRQGLDSLHGKSKL
ncbi:complex I intermediate-associated protein 30-domain-containing protein [Leucosporidium creatinivorum]|uniref:Complex I intermediate-associated protein 30-domain-containing protein n=1 Tax=Leucosporidium creatinivorum TaxID=106004 RepID=A0A1Y2FRQ9_9BASI|nr:complex I intermediate-associated protein 30-domain-containing protein [Leucosporidium creatinivorum]